MAWFDEFNDDAVISDANTFAPPRPKEPEKPSLFAGVGQLPKAIPSGLSKVGSAALNNSPTNIIADTLGYAYYRSKAAFNDQEAIPFDEFYTIQQEGREEFGKTAIDAYKLNPQKTGAATNVLFQLGDVVTQAGTGGILTGGIGGAATVAGLGVGNASFLDQMGRGVDRNTAIKIGITEGIATGIGVALPVSRIVPGSGLAVRAADATVSIGGAVGIGMGMRGANNAILDEAGYKAEAKRYDPFDKTSIAIDLTLATLFHTGSVYLGSRAANQATPEQVAAALTASQEAHAQSMAPVVPSSAADVNAHLANLDSATNSLLTGTPVNVTRNVSSAPKPSLPGQASRIADAAQQAGINPNTALLISHIETGGRFNPDAQNPTSSANGLFQVIDSSWKRLGGGDRTNVSEQIRVGLAHMKEVATVLTNALKRTPQVHEEYMGHLLGAGGASKVLTADPNARLYDVVYSYTRGKTAAQRAKTAQAVVNNNGMKGLTVGQAIAKWQNKAADVQAKIGGRTDAPLGRAVDEAPEIIPIRDDLLPDVMARDVFDRIGTPSRDRFSEQEAIAIESLPHLEQSIQTLADHPTTVDFHQGAVNTLHGSKVENLEFREDWSATTNQADKSYFDNVFGDDVVYLGERGQNWSTRNKQEAHDMRMPYYPYQYDVNAGFSKAFVLTPESAHRLAAIIPERGLSRSGVGFSGKASGADVVRNLKKAGYDGLIIRGFDGKNIKAEKVLEASTGLRGDIFQNQIVAFNPKALKVNSTKSANAPKPPDSAPASRDNADNTTNQSDPIEQAAADILVSDPDMQIGVARINAEGETEIVTMSIREAMEQADMEIKAAQEQGVAAQAAASCALRFGV